MVAWVVELVSSVGADPPAVDPQAPPGAEKLTTIINWVAWIATALGVAGILIVAVTMMFRNDRGEGSHAGSKLGWVMGGLILVSSASAIVGLLT